MIYVDFEFCKVTSRNVNLVCCTTLLNGDIREWWLFNDALAQADLVDFFESHKNIPVCGYATVAESRSFLAMGLNPSKDFNWIDLFLEWRQLTNHNDDLLYGEQLVDGKVKVTRKPPPKWERTEEDALGAFKPTHSLAEATFKLTKQIRDTDQKNRMRDIIISCDEALIEANKKEIQDYCTEDVKFLPVIFQRIVEEYKKLGVWNMVELTDEMYLRGKYSALTAKMEQIGYPIDYEKTKNFSASVAPIIEECQREINALFPEIKPFKFDRKEQKFKWDQKSTREWLKNNVNTARWLKTDGMKKAQKLVIQRLTENTMLTWKRKPTSREKDKALETMDVGPFLSLSLDAWTKQYDYKHEYPKESFPAQMIRYLKLKQNLNGFVPNKNGSFWDAVGPDNRVRPYFNHYGSLSSRSQPGSRSFLFLKPAWMRALCMPKAGRAICGVDYGSQEYLISALVSGDDEMVKSYLSGDVYMAFALASGMAPKGATKETHKAERNLAKAAVLGMSYLMTAIGLSADLSEKTGRIVTEDEAQDIIDAFYDVYSELGEWQEAIQKQYAQDGFLKLPCGWTLWADNDNFRSVVNFNIQGMGAAIMRKAVEFCDEAGLEVILTLHDALYIEYDASNYGAVDTLLDCMKRAFVFYFPAHQKDKAAKIKMDAFCWSRDYPAPTYEGKKKTYATITTPKGLEIDVADIYIDERAEKEYTQFSKYFHDREEDEL
jgi:hypothetical protein